MAPVTLLRRQDLTVGEAITTSPEPAPLLSAAAHAVRAALGAGGALFFDDLLARLRLLPSQLEAALSELAGQGLAVCEGFAGLRALSARAPRILPRRERPYSALKTTLKGEINDEAWATRNSDTSRTFATPKSGRIAVKVISRLGDEVMKVFRV